MIVRVLLVAAALALGGLALVRHHEVASCQDALDRAFAVVREQGDAAATARAVRDRCRDSDDVANAAVTLSGGSPRAQAIAASLAAEAVGREPDNPRTWLAQAFVLRTRDPAAAAAAQARATALNPYAPVVVAPSG